MPILNESEIEQRVQARLQKYMEIVSESMQIFEDRNRKYGDAISRTGLLGSVVSMVGDYERLQNMVMRSPDHGRGNPEDVRDKLIDVLNYVVIGVMMLDERNWEGK